MFFFFLHSVTLLMAHVHSFYLTGLWSERYISTWRWRRIQVKILVLGFNFRMVFPNDFAIKPVTTVRKMRFRFIKLNRSKTLSCFRTYNCFHASLINLKHFYIALTYVLELILANPKLLYKVNLRKLYYVITCFIRRQFQFEILSKLQRAFAALSQSYARLFWASGIPANLNILLSNS